MKEQIGTVGAVCKKFVAARDVSLDGLGRLDMERGSDGVGNRCGQILSQEGRSSVEQLFAPFFIARKRTNAQQGNFVTRKERARIKIVLPEPSPNHDVADSESGLSRSRNACEEDFTDGEIGNKISGRRGRSDFAPSRKDHNHRRAPKMTRV